MGLGVFVITMCVLSMRQLQQGVCHCLVLVGILLTLKLKNMTLVEKNVFLKNIWPKMEFSEAKNSMQRHFVTPKTAPRLVKRFSLNLFQCAKLDKKLHKITRTKQMKDFRDSFLRGFMPSPVLQV